MMRPQRGEIVRRNKGFSDIESAKLHKQTSPENKKKKTQLSSYYIIHKVTFQYESFKGGGGRRFAASADSLLHNEQLAALCSAEPGNVSTIDVASDAFCSR